MAWAILHSQMFPQAVDLKAVTNVQSQDQLSRITSDYPIAIDSSRVIDLFTSTSTIVFKVDMGVGYTSRDSQPDTFVLGDVLRLSNLTVVGATEGRLSAFDISTSTDDISYSSVHSGSYTAASEGKDIYRALEAVSITVGAKVRYWRITLTFTGTASGTIVKREQLNCFWLCNKIDPGKYPDQISVAPRFEQTVVSKMGTLNKWVPSLAAKPIEYSFTYEALSSAKVAALEAIQNDLSIMMWTNGDGASPIFLDSELVHLELTRFETKRTFRESGRYDVLIEGVTI